jgi:hypothetical protein
MKPIFYPKKFKAMSQKKEKQIRKMAAKIASQMKPQTYMAKIGIFIPANTPTPQGPASSDMIKYEWSEFTYNNLRAAKNYIKKHLKKLSHENKTR